jgi:hypothetical protein
MDRKAAGEWKQGRWTTLYELHNDMDITDFALAESTSNRSAQND